MLVATLSLPGSELPVLHLTLKEALRIALDQNPQIHRSLLTMAQSEEDRRMARAALLLTVDAFGSLQKNKLNLDTFLGEPSKGGPDVVGPYNWGQIGVEAQIPLFDLNLWQKWQAAQEGEAAAKAQTRTVREGITALTVGQYLRALRGLESVKASESRVELAQALEKLAEDQQTHGVGTKLDTLRSQVQLQNERQRLIQAQTLLKTSLFGLSKLMNVDPNTPIELADRLAAPEIPAFTFEQAYQNGLNARPELATLEAQKKAAENLQNAARSLHLPTVMLNGSFTSVGLFPSEPWVPVYQITVGVKVPLFTGGLISAQVAKAKEELAKIQEDRRDAETQMGLDVQVAQAELDSARNEVEVATQTVTLANEALTQARHRFEAGVSNNIEVINAQDELARANDNQINALYRLNQARADLAKAMGQMESLFVQ